MNHTLTIKKTVAIFVAITFALSPAPVSFADPAPVAEVNGQNVPVVPVDMDGNPDEPTLSSDLQNHMAQSEGSEQSDYDDPSVLSAPTSEEQSIEEVVQAVIERDFKDIPVTTDLGGGTTRSGAEYAFVVKTQDETSRASDMNYYYDAEGAPVHSAFRSDEVMNTLLENYPSASIYQNDDGTFMAEDYGSFTRYTFDHDGNEIGSEYMYEYDSYYYDSYYADAETILSQNHSGQNASIDYSSGNTYYGSYYAFSITNHDDGTVYLYDDYGSLVETTSQKQRIIESLYASYPSASVYENGDGTITLEDYSSYYRVTYDENLNEISSEYMYEYDSAYYDYASDPNYYDDPAHTMYDGHSSLEELAAARFPGNETSIEYTSGNSPNGTYYNTLIFNLTDQTVLYVTDSGYVGDETSVEDFVSHKIRNENSMITDVYSNGNGGYIGQYTYSYGYYYETNYVEYDSRGNQTNSWSEQSYDESYYYDYYSDYYYYDDYYSYRSPEDVQMQDFSGQNTSIDYNSGRSSNGSYFAFSILNHDTNERSFYDDYGSWVDSAVEETTNFEELSEDEANRLTAVIQLGSEQGESPVFYKSVISESVVECAVEGPGCGQMSRVTAYFDQSGNKIMEIHENPNFNEYSDTLIKTVHLLDGEVITIANESENSLIAKQGEYFYVVQKRDNGSYEVSAALKPFIETENNNLAVGYLEETPAYVHSEKHDGGIACTTSIPPKCSGSDQTDHFYYSAAGIYLGKVSDIAMATGSENIERYTLVYGPENDKEPIARIDNLGRVKDPKMIEAVDFIEEATLAFKEPPIYQKKIETRPSCSGEGQDAVCTDVMPQDTIEYYDAEKNLLGRVVVQLWDDEEKTWYDADWNVIQLRESIEPRNLDERNITLDNGSRMDYDRGTGIAVITDAQGNSVQHSHVILFTVEEEYCSAEGECGTIMADMSEDMRDARQIGSFIRQQTFEDGSTSVQRVLVYTNPPRVPEAVTNYVADLQQALPNYTVSVEKQNDETYLVRVSHQPCPEGMECALVAPAPGSFGGMTFSLNSDGTRAKGSMLIDYNGINVEGDDAEILFKAMGTCPQGQNCNMRIMTEIETLTELTKASVTKVEDNTIFFRKENTDYKAFRNEAGNVQVEIEPLIPVFKAEARSKQALLEKWPDLNLDTAMISTRLLRASDLSDGTEIPNGFKAVYLVEISFGGMNLAYVAGINAEGASAAFPTLTAQDLISQIKTLDESDKDAGTILGENPVFKMDLPAIDGQSTTGYFNAEGKLVGTRTIIGDLLNRSNTVTTWRGAQGNTKQIETVIAYENGHVYSYVQDAYMRLMRTEDKNEDGSRQTWEYLYDNDASRDWHKAISYLYDRQGNFVRINQVHRLGEFSISSYTDQAGNFIEDTLIYDNENNFVSVDFPNENRFVLDGVLYQIEIVDGVVKLTPAEVSIPPAVAAYVEELQETLGDGFRFEIVNRQDGTWGVYGWDNKEYALPLDAGLKHFKFILDESASQPQGLVLVFHSTENSDGIYLGGEKAQLMNDAIASLFNNPYEKQSASHLARNLTNMIVVDSVYSENETLKFEIDKYGKKYAVSRDQDGAVVVVEESILPPAVAAYQTAFGDGFEVSIVAENGKFLVSATDSKQWILDSDQNLVEPKSGLQSMKFTVDENGNVVADSVGVNFYGDKVKIDGNLLFEGLKNLLIAESIVDNGEMISARYITDMEALVEMTKITVAKVEDGTIHFTNDGTNYKAYRDEAGNVVVELDLDRLEQLRTDILKRVDDLQGENDERIVQLLVQLEEAKQRAKQDAGEFESKLNELVANLQTLLNQMRELLLKDDTRPSNREAIGQVLEDAEDYLNNSLEEQKAEYIMFLMRSSEVMLLEDEIAAYEDLNRRLLIYQEEVAQESSLEKLLELEQGFPEIIMPSTDQTVDQQSYDPTEFLRDMARDAQQSIDQTNQDKIQLGMQIFNAQKTIELALRPLMGMPPVINEDDLPEWDAIFSKAAEDVRAALQGLHDWMHGQDYFYYHPIDPRLPSTQRFPAPQKVQDLENDAMSSLRNFYENLMMRSVQITSFRGNLGEKMKVPVSELVGIIFEELEALGLDRASAPEIYLELKGLTANDVGEFHPEDGVFTSSIFTDAVMDMAMGPSLKDLRNMVIRFISRPDNADVFVGTTSIDPETFRLLLLERETVSQDEADQAKAGLALKTNAVVTSKRVTEFALSCGDNEFAPCEGDLEVITEYFSDKDHGFEYHGQKIEMFDGDVLVSTKWIDAGGNVNPGQPKEFYADAIAEHLGIAVTDIIKIESENRQFNTCHGTGCPTWSKYLDVTAKVNGAEKHFAGYVVGGAWGQEPVMITNVDKPNQMANKIDAAYGNVRSIFLLETDPLITGRILEEAGESIGVSLNHFTKIESEHSPVCYGPNCPIWSLSVRLELKQGENPARVFSGTITQTLEGTVVNFDEVKLLPEDAVKLSATEFDLAINALGLNKDAVGDLYKTISDITVNCDATTPCYENTALETFYYQKDGAWLRAGYKEISGKEIVFMNAEKGVTQRLEIVDDPNELELVRKILVAQTPEYRNSFWKMWSEVRGQALYIANYSGDNRDEDEREKNKKWWISFI